MISFFSFLCKIVKKLPIWGKICLLVSMIMIPTGYFLFKEDGESAVASTLTEQEMMELTMQSGFSIQNLKSAFLFEINRHGARAAFLNDPWAFEGSSAAP